MKLKQQNTSASSSPLTNSKLLSTWFSLT